MSSIRALKYALQGIASDRSLLDQLSRGSTRAGFMAPTLRAGFLFRVASFGGRAGKIARSLLMLLHGSDCSEGAIFEGAVYFPHPVGIVVGSGVRIGDGVWLYQHVTLGADGKGRYPSIGPAARIYPGALVAGSISVGAGALVGAGVHLNSSIAPNNVIRANWTPRDQHEDPHKEEKS